MRSARVEEARAASDNEATTEERYGQKRGTIAGNAGLTTSVTLLRDA